MSEESRDIGNQQQSNIEDVVQDGWMEDFYTNIFHVLSNVELPSTLPEEQSKQQFLEKGESSGHGIVTKATATEKSDSHHDENQMRDTKRSRRDHQPTRSRTAELHNLSERIRRDRITRKMKALQDLIPNCNTRDKASMLDDVIKYIKSLQRQILMMSPGAGAMLQNPYALQAGYQGVPVPQFPSQFMPVRPGIGMEMYGMPCSAILPLMPFPLAASPCQSSLAASGMAIGQIPQLQLSQNPFQQPLPSADSDSTSSFASLDSTSICTTQAETSSVNVQGSIVSVSSVILLPSQMITPISTSSTSVAVDQGPRSPEEGDESDLNER